VSGSDRPLARAETAFRRLYADRVSDYERDADASAEDVEGVLLAALRIEVERGLVDRLGDYVPAPAALVADERALTLHPPALDAAVHRVPPGETAKTIAVAGRVWDELALDRAGTLVAFGGGATTDLAGFVAATYLRGIPWIAVPTTLVGQVDAAIGGKTAINLAKGKNLAGAFHYPQRVLADPDVLRTLPEEEWRAGMAEVVKTGLLAGRELWTEDVGAMVRGSAAFKAAVCLSDPLETTGRRSILNLGHTFAHALETASGYALSHGDAVALGLLGALRLSGLETDVVADVLRPKPVRVDRERAWAALQRDKKARDGRIRLVLLERPGKPVFPVELPESEVRAALASLVED
jgi:3-dehydroquinate synthetase